MRGISDQNIIGKLDAGFEHWSDIPDDTLLIRPNDSNPFGYYDNLPSIFVTPVSQDEFRLDKLVPSKKPIRVTKEGLEELGVTLFGFGFREPNWYIPRKSSSTELPEWAPDSFVLEPYLICIRCMDYTLARKIVKPNEGHQKTIEQYCEECWNDIRKEWPKRYHSDTAAHARSRELCDIAREDPEKIKIRELFDLLNSHDYRVVYNALVVFNWLIESRASDLLDLVPLLSTFDTEWSWIRTSPAIHCLAYMAAMYPHHLTPVTDAVISELQSASTGAIVQPALSYLAAIAYELPEAVTDAVPILLDVIQEGRLHQETAILTLLRITNECPEAVDPILEELITLLDDKDQVMLVGLFAVIVRILKADPDIT